MIFAGLWLGLEVRRRRRSQAVLTVRIALASGAVLASVAGARSQHGLDVVRRGSASRTF